MQRDYAWTLLRAFGVTEGILKGDETKLPRQEKGITKHGQSYRIEPEQLTLLGGFKDQLRLDGFDLAKPITVTRSPAPIIDALRFAQ